MGQAILHSSFVRRNWGGRGRFWGSLLAAILMVVGLSVRSRAVTFTWNFDSPPGAVAASYTYKDTTGTYSITAYGYVVQNSPSNPAIGSVWTTGTETANQLYDKSTAGDPSETGLGLNNKLDDEIDTQSFVQLDVSGLKNKGMYGLTMYISSIQQTEGYDLWGSNTLGTPGTLLADYTNTTGATGADVQSLVVPGFTQYNYFSISASGGNVLLRNGLSINTPEPGSYALLVCGMLSGLGFMFGRRRK